MKRCSQKLTPSKTHYKAISAAVCILLSLVACALGVVQCFALFPSYNSLDEGATIQYVTSPFKASEIKLGDLLTFNLWNDDTGAQTRIVYNSVDYVDVFRLRNGDQTIYQEGLVYEGLLDSSPIDDYSTKRPTLYYTKSYVDDGGQPDYYYNPESGFWYDKLHMYISVERNGANANSQDFISYAYSWVDDSGQNKSVQVVDILKEGEYTFTCMVAFEDTQDRTENQATLNPPMSFTQNVNVRSINSLTDEAYNNGYASGYQAGRADGINSDEEFTIYGLINAVINAPITFIESALDFDIFGINVASFVKMLFTLLMVAFVVVVVLKVVL